MTDYLHRRSYWRDLVTIQQTALAAARRIGDRRRELNAYSFLALACTFLGRYDEAERYQRTIIELDPGTMLAAQAHLDLGLVFDRQGRYPEALREAHEALDAFRDLDSVPGLARALSAVGWVQSRLGNHEQALARCQEALVLFEKLNAIATNWDSIGYAHHHLGQYPAAVAAFERAIELFTAVGDRRYRMTTLTHLGDTYLATGDRAGARKSWRAALVLADEIDDADGARLRGKLAGLVET
jgi:tetratricopeptide (TPR) repeat protein